MSRRIVLAGVIVILFIVVGGGILLLKSKSNTVANPLKTIPLDAAVVIQINSFEELENDLFTENDIFSDLKTFPVFSEMNRIIARIDSVAGGHDGMKELVHEARLFLSAHYIGGRKISYLLVAAPENPRALGNLPGTLRSATGQDISRSERKYEGESIYAVEFKPDGQEKTYYLTTFGGNLFISKSVILIENVIRQKNLGESLMDDQEFMDIAATAGKNKPANLFVDQRKLTAFLSAIGNDDFAPRLRQYKDLGGWLELDLNVNEKQIMLNGFTDPLEGENSFLDLFTQNEPIPFTVDRILPASVSAFVAFGAEDIPLMVQKYHQYLSASGKFTRRSNRLKELEKKYDIRLEEIFTTLLDNEITMAQAGYNSGTAETPARYVILKCKSGTQAEKTLESVVIKMAEVNQSSAASLMKEYSIDSETRFPIVSFPEQQITGLLFGDLFALSGNTYYTFLGNYLIFSNSQEALGHFLYSNVLSRTLSTNAAYKKFSGNIDQESFILFYTNLSRSSAVFREYVDIDIIRTWEQHFDKIQNIQSLGIQYTEVSDKGYNNMLLQYVDARQEKPQTIWESLLDTSFLFKPQLVENHYTGQKEIFLQDRNHTLYLINKAGRIIWKQGISEPINSEVYQIDYYKNGKLQLLFSTENYLHLIDRNGNYVERYPVRLRERSTAGMSLFDYENNRNYRIFIPCADQKVYAYAKDGTVVSGWDFEGAETAISQPVKHFRIGEKDFIVFSDRFRTYILNRRGNIRIPVNTLFAHSRNNGIFLEAGESTDDSYMFTTDTAGAIIRIGFNGKVQRLELGEFSSGHFFDLKDVDADGRKDFIILDRENLFVYDQDKKEILHQGFPNVITNPPIYFRFSYNDRKLGICDAEEGLIYLVNNDGNVYDGFPLEGHTLFSIGYLEGERKDFNLIVGGRNNFLYNYSVQ